MAAAARDLPWRRRRTPWRALASEFMLQQTQVARVVERFEGFMREFPTARAMARRSEASVVRAWAGLGYYRRARNLHKLSIALVERHGGSVPSTVSELQALPGIGRYTAGAIASIVFGQRVPIVDGNVARVLLRVHGEALPLGARDTDAWLWERAEEFVASADDPSLANEGLMELGALVCTPRAPQCEACPLAKVCRARAEGVAESLPVKGSKLRRREWHGEAVVCVRGSRVLMTQRNAGDLWGGMWLLPLLEGGGRRGRAQVRFDTSACRLNIGVRVDRGAATRERASAVAARLGIPGPAKWVDVRRAPEVRVGVVARVLEAALK